nr:unnamed protein product [Digitaria exilis]
MDARLATTTALLLLLLAAAAPLLASAQLANDFYKTSCPDAEKIIFGVVEKRFKQDPGTAAGLLRLVFHDCFANGCDASILIDPLSNQASEKEAGPNISVRGYDVIEEIKEELEKKCPGVVSCADIVVASAREGVKLTGGPTYEVPMGRRDSLTSNREDADGLPGPDIAVPKLIDEFAKQGFSLEEMVAMLAGGHSIGICRCFFIEADAAPIDADYRKNISAACDGKDSGSVPMDFATPNVFDGSYFALALAKKMPLTIDRLVGMDPKTEPVLKAMEAKPADFLPMFTKAMVKLGALKVLTGKEGEIRKSCSEFNNPQASGGASVIRTSSINPDMMAAGLSSEPAAALSNRKVGGARVPEATTIADPAAAELEAKRQRNVAKIVKTNAKEAAAKVEGGVVVNNAGQIQPPNVVPIIQPPNNVVPPIVNKDAGVQAAGQGSVEASKMIAAGNKVLGDEPASKLPVPDGPKLRGGQL